MSDEQAEPVTRSRRASHEYEAHSGDLASRLNWLRAGVLGANDGIVSVAGLVVGVAGATTDRLAIFTAGVAGVVAGALSMAGGEYVSVSTQKDTEKAMIELEKWELTHLPEHELEELTAIYQAKGISSGLARKVAEELTAHDALAAHAEVELKIDPDELTNPWHAAWASFVSFFAGALLPMAAILLPPQGLRVAVCFAAVVVALAVTGWVSARLGKAPIRPAVRRNVAIGALGMAITYAIGSMIGMAL